VKRGLFQMPTYQYACTSDDCGLRFERVQSFTDAAISECPQCSERVRKVYGSVGVVFKGSGFYRNDSRDAKAGAAAARSESSGDSSASDSKGSDSKNSDAKGSDSKSSDAKGSDSKGSDSKGSDSKGDKPKVPGESRASAKSAGSSKSESGKSASLANSS